MLMTSNMAFSICALLLSSSCVLFYMARKNLQKRQSILFLFILLGMVLVAAMEVINDYIEARAGSLTQSRVKMFFICNEIYFLIHTALPVLYCFYVMEVNGVAVNMKARVRRILITPFVMAEIMVFSNLWNKQTFYVSEEQRFAREPLEAVLYVLASAYLLVGVFYLLKFKKALTKRVFRAVWYFYALAFIGIFAQLMVENLKVELFLEAVSLMGVMVSIESEEGIVDPVVGVYDRKAFMNEYVKLERTGHKFTVMTVHIQNVRIINHMLAYEEAQEFYRELTKWLKPQDGKGGIYRISPGKFAVIDYNSDDAYLDDLVERIKARHEEKWDVKDISIELNSFIQIAKIPEDISQNIIDLVDVEAPEEVSGLVIRRGKELEYLHEDLDVEEYIREALEKDSFEVYYQPIYSTSEKKVEAAEALL